jgi:hypothetical protein
MMAISLWTHFLKGSQVFPWKGEVREGTFLEFAIISRDGDVLARLWVEWTCLVVSFGALDNVH